MLLAKYFGDIFKFSNKLPKRSGALFSSSDNELIIMFLTSIFLLSMSLLKLALLVIILLPLYNYLIVSNDYLKLSFDFFYYF